MSWSPDELRRPDGTWKVTDAELQAAGAQTRLGDLVWQMHKHHAAALELTVGHPPLALVQGARLPLAEEPLTGSATVRMVLLALREEPQRHRMLEQGVIDEVLEHPMGSYRLQARLVGGQLEGRIEPLSTPASAPPPPPPRPSPAPERQAPDQQAPERTAPEQPAAGPPPAPEPPPPPPLLASPPRTPVTRPEPYLLLGSPNGGYQVALFPDCCLFFREGQQLARAALPGLPLMGAKPYLDDAATLHFPATGGLLRVNDRGEIRQSTGTGRVDVRVDGQQWLYCQEAGTRGLLGGSSKIYQMTLATAQDKLVYFETRSRPEWAISPRFEYLLVGEPRRGKLALHLILVAEESVVQEFELARPRDLQVEDGGLMLLEFGDSASPEWVLCRSEAGKLQSSQWKPPPGTRRGWPVRAGAIAITETQVIRLGLQGQGVQQVRVADRTIAKLWDIVPDNQQGAQLLVWESGRLLALPLWDTPGPVRPTLPLEELLTHLTQANCGGAWLEPGKKFMLDTGQAWGDMVASEQDIASWVEQARRYAGVQSSSFRRRALNHEYTITVVEGARVGLRIQRVEAGP